MTCAVLCIGTELTRGELVNTNAAWLASALTDLGFDVIEDIVVDDDSARIAATLDRLGKTVRVLVCTGGLGPTTDDLTTQAVAGVLGVKVVRDDASLEAIRRRVEKADAPSRRATRSRPTSRRAPTFFRTPSARRRASA